MKLLDEKYFEDVFDKIRLVWDTKHFIKIETVKLLKQIATDAREEQRKVDDEKFIELERLAKMGKKEVIATLDRAKG